MRGLVPLNAFVTLPALVWAQGAPGTHLRVDVRATRFEMRDDTGRVEYVVRNHPESEEELFKLRVEAPSAVLRITRPDPPQKWATSTRSKGLSMAAWGLLGTHLPPGAEAGPLAFEALGLPTIVTYYASGWFPVPKYAPVEPAPSPAPRDAILANSVPGQTVGIEPFPEDLSPANLLKRIGRLAEEACKLAWITSAGVCHSLQTKLDQARASLSRGEIESAKGQISSFLAELDAQHGAEPGKHVTDNAYWLLKINAEDVASRL